MNGMICKKKWNIFAMHHLQDSRIFIRFWSVDVISPKKADKPSDRAKIEMQLLRDPVYKGFYAFGFSCNKLDSLFPLKRSPVLICFYQY